MTATVGTDNSARRSTTACALMSCDSTAATSGMLRNSPMSAPAMNPAGFPERRTTPLGGRDSMLARTSLSSASPSCESVLALAPALSNTTQAMPSSSRASFQLRHGPSGAPATGPSSRSRGARMSQTFPISPLLDQQGAPLPAADAFGGVALLDAEPLHGVHEVEHDAVAARAHRMAQPDRPAIDVELVARDAAGGTGKAQ